MPPMSLPAHLPPSWTLLSLRPRGQHAPLRRLATAAGGRLLALSPWAIVPRTSAADRQQLAAALACPQVLFTSPAAVQAANALLPLAGIDPPPAWLAVGEGRKALIKEDLVRAIASADHYHAFSPAFGTGTFRRRVRILNQLGDINRLAAWYCR